MALDNARSQKQAHAYPGHTRQEPLERRQGDKEEEEEAQEAPQAPPPQGRGDRVDASGAVGAVAAGQQVLGGEERRPPGGRAGEQGRDDQAGLCHPQTLPDC